MDSLAGALRQLHAVELPPQLAHPPSIAGGPAVLPLTYPGLVREFIADLEAGSVVTADMAIRAEAIVSRCEPALVGGVVGTVHTDLTFANAIWDGTRMWLLDLEF